MADDTVIIYDWLTPLRELAEEIQKEKKSDG
jgi:hypothetical protein